MMNVEEGEQEMRKEGSDFFHDRIMCLRYNRVLSAFWDSSEFLPI